MKLSYSKGKLFVRLNALKKYNEKKAQGYNEGFFTIIIRCSRVQF